MLFSTLSKGFTGISYRRYDRPKSGSGAASGRQEVSGTAGQEASATILGDS
jgi:hypothetical protein